jgi:hypothetical protein
MLTGFPLLHESLRTVVWDSHRVSRRTDGLRELSLAQPHRLPRATQRQIGRSRERSRRHSVTANTNGSDAPAPGHADLPASCAPSGVAPRLKRVPSLPEYPAIISVIGRSALLERSNTTDRTFPGVCDPVAADQQTGCCRVSSAVCDRISALCCQDEDLRQDSRPDLSPDFSQVARRRT